MIIGVDVDDVLVDTSTYLLSYLNGIFQTSFRRDQIVSWNIEDLFEGVAPREDVEARILEHLSEKSVETLPVHGSVEALTKLKKGNSIIAVTARYAEFAEITQRSLQKHFGGVCSIYHAGLTGKNRERKSDIIRKTGIEIYVDDRLEYALDCAGTGKRILLYDQPWNQNGNLPGNVTRVYDWNQILEEITSIGNCY